MRSFVVAATVVTLAFAAFAYAEANPQPSPDKKEVSITLTAEQVKVVKEAAGKSVQIQLTKEQLNAIGPGDPRIPGTLTLNTYHLRRGDVVVVKMEIYKDRISMDPQPSP